MEIECEFVNPKIQIIPIVPLEVMGFSDYALNQLKLLEEVGRTCYLSHDKMKENSYDTFLRGIIRSGHESVIEHGSVTVRVLCSRAASHQLVRHRIGSYSQESQRYVNYAKKGFFRFIKNKETESLKDYLNNVCREYTRLIDSGMRAEDARAILPNAISTNLAITYNFRQWRSFFRNRCDSHAQREIRSIALVLLNEFYKFYPSLFFDLADIYLCGNKQIPKYEQTDNKEFLEYEIDIL